MAKLYKWAPRALDWSFLCLCWKGRCIQGPRPYRPSWRGAALSWRSSVKAGAEVAVEVANKCSVEKAVPGTEKKAEETRWRRQSNVVSGFGSAIFVCTHWCERDCFMVEGPCSVKNVVCLAFCSFKHLLEYGIFRWQVCVTLKNNSVWNRWYYTDFSLTTLVACVQNGHTGTSGKGRMLQHRTL